MTISGGGVGTWYETGLVENGLVGSAAVYYGQVTSSGQTTVTITDTGGNNYPSGVGGEFYGISPSAPLAVGAGSQSAAVGSSFSLPQLYSGPLQLYVGGGYHAAGVASPYTIGGSATGQTLTNFANVAHLSSSTTAYNLGLWGIWTSGSLSYASPYRFAPYYTASSSSNFVSSAAIFNAATIQRLGALMQGGTITDNPLSSTATTMDSAGLANFPTVINGETYAAVTIYDQTGTITTPEVVWITAHASGATSATVLRGQEGSTARSHGQGEAWVNGPTTLDYAQQLLAPPQNYFAGQEYFDAATGQMYVFNGLDFVADTNEGLFWMEVGP
jgi:hypothetical protein